MFTAILIFLVVLSLIPILIVLKFGKPSEVLLAIILTAMGILPGYMYAIFVAITNNKGKEKRD